jgi:tRNA pseudouridine55 synthase
MFHGFISIDKPAAITAHDCVSKLRKLLKQKKIGHGGTLDPMATGVLPIAVGDATRLLRFLPEGKAYNAKIRFGLVTNTDDITGEIISDRPCNELSDDISRTITLESIQDLLPLFQGKIVQRPPAFSAIQIDGKRLYDLARRGEITAEDVPTRMVEITEIKVLGWQNGAYPELDLAIACGSGTYIRAIARDLGEKLGCGATLAGLRRTYSNGFDLGASLTFEQVAEKLQSGNLQVLAPDHGLHLLPMVLLDADSARRWQMGQAVSTDNLPLLGNESANSFVRTHDQAQSFLGVSEVRNNLLHPVVVLPKHF